MNVVCYGHPTDKTFHDTWGKIQKASPEWGLELHLSLDSFAARLRQPGMNIAVVMLYIADKQSLSELLAVRSFLNDLPVLILLNHQEPEILKFAHELRPRVIMYTCWKVKDICSVLQRCIGRYGNQEGAWTAAARNAPSKVVDGLEKKGGRRMQILTVKEIAGVLQLKENTVCSLASRGTLPGFKLGRAWRFDLGTVESLFARRPQRGADQPEGDRNKIRKEVRWDG